MSVTVKDVQAYVRSLRTQNTPWSNGCADIILKLWEMRHRRDGELVELRHIGIGRALCHRRKKANLRADMGVEYYQRAGMDEGHRLRNEAPYVICPCCIAKLP